MTELGLEEGLDDEFTLVDQIEIDALAEENAKHLKRQEIMRTRKVAYARVFIDGGATKDDMAIVLADLRLFCRHKRSTFHPNVQVAARLDGRREVALRIDEYLELSIDELVQLRT